MHGHATGHAMRIAVLRILPRALALILLLGHGRGVHASTSSCSLPSVTHDLMSDSGTSAASQNALLKQRLRPIKRERAFVAASRRVPFAPAAGGTPRTSLDGSASGPHSAE